MDHPETGVCCESSRPAPGESASRQVASIELAVSLVRSLFCGLPRLEDLGIFLEHCGRKARPHEPLVDGEKQQGFIARGRDQGRYEDIRINDRPNHFFFSRLYALISPSISWEVSLSSPRRFALAQDFSSHFGGGAMVLMKSLTLMMTTAGSPRRSTIKRSLFSMARVIICPNCVRAT